jgi:hypothetical protein
MDYAQARIQARFGSRPGPLVWERLQGIPETDEFLEAAKRAGLGHWVAGLERRTGLHRVELVLRDRLRALIRETASWLPDRWQRPTALTAQLVDLPALAHLARGGSTLAWMKDDAVMAAYLSAAAPAKRDALLSATQRDRLFKSSISKSSSSGIAAALKEWMSLWRESWPSGSESASVSRLVRRAEAHLASFAACETGERADGLRDELDRELRREFRHNTLLPGAVLAYLGMEALDCERVRSMLVDRVRPADQGISP